MGRLLPLIVVFTSPLLAPAATVLVLQFHNSSPQTDLNWVGESIAERLRVEFGAGNQIVQTRESQTEALRRLSLRPDADFTKASLIKLGQSLGCEFCLLRQLRVQIARRQQLNSRQLDSDHRTLPGPPQDARWQ